MTDADRAHRARDRTSLMLMFFVLAAIALIREGAHLDRTVGAERLGTIAFFSGGIIGFAAWTRYTGITPAFSLSGPSRQLWLATALAALFTTTAASYVNRTLATLT